MPSDTSQLKNEQLQFNLRKDLSHLALPGPHFLHHDHHRTQTRKTLQGVRRENHTIRACDICPHLDPLELTWSQISTHAMTSLANSWGTLNAVRRRCSSERGHSARRQRVCGMARVSVKYPAGIKRAAINHPPSSSFAMPEPGRYSQMKSSFGGAAPRTR